MLLSAEGDLCKIWSEPWTRLWSLWYDRTVSAWSSQWLLHQEVIWALWLPGDGGPQRTWCIILLLLPAYASIHLTSSSWWENPEAFACVVILQRTIGLYLVVTQHVSQLPVSMETAACAPSVCLPDCVSDHMWVTEDPEQIIINLPAESRVSGVASPSGYTS